MLLVVVKIEFFIAMIIIYAVIFLLFILIKKEMKRKKEFLTSVMYKLMEMNFSNVEKSSSRLYNVKFSYDGKDFYVKFFEGGNRKGIVMTNKQMVHLQYYSKEFGPSKNNEVASSINSFLIEPINGIKVVLFKNNLLRMSKYINENEIVEIKYNVPSFGSFMVQEKDFDSFLKFIKNSKKK